MEQQIEWTFKLAEQDFEIVSVVVGDDLRNRAGDVQWSSGPDVGCVFVHRGLTLSARQTGATKDLIQHWACDLSRLFKTMVQDLIELLVGDLSHTLLDRDLIELLVGD